LKTILSRDSCGNGFCALSQLSAPSPAKGGIRPASRFEYEFEDPVLKRSIRHAYDVIALPVLG
jgi:hypothetical protein